MWDLINKLNLLQKTQRFKIISTIIVLVFAIGGYVWLLQSWKYHTSEQHLIDMSTQNIIENYGILTDFLHVANVQVETAIVLSFIVAAFIFLIWLGVGMTGLSVALIAIFAFLLTFFSRDSFPYNAGKLVLGFTPLILIFATLLELARILLSMPSAVASIARNVVTEAVRMKIGLIFILVLIAFLAILPNFLSDDQPLRYRVQQWLQWGTGLSFLIASMFTLFFGCASVAFEQRDRVIWQTMTKPIASWKYVLGKWIGVMTINLVLLVVMASGVFLFTEYLSRQPADGEIAYHINQRQQNTRDNPAAMSIDRFVLETQVLVAREGVMPDEVDFERGEIKERLDELVDQELVRFQQERPDSGISNAERNEIRSAIIETVRARSRALLPAAPGSPTGPPIPFVFSGLADIRDSGVTEMTLRWRVQAGSNDPSDVYRFLFVFNGESYIEESAALDGTQTIPLDPARAIREDGTLIVEIAALPGNERTAVIPPDGLELMVTRGGYAANFSRIIFVMWVKLGFLAAIAIAASTIVSFPVAVLVSLVVWFAAESSGFLITSLDWFKVQTSSGSTIWLNTIAKTIASPIAWSMQEYAALRPTEKLVEGRLLGWFELGRGLAFVGAWTLGSLLLGILIFRKRELALYSGK
ncbi:MAG: ABC transporter permease subunit [Planctomycetota bacterium]